MLVSARKSTGTQGKDDLNPAMQAAIEDLSDPCQDPQPATEMGGRVLMVAFHYPPFAASSGYLRTRFLSRYLTNSGWEPTILTVRPGAYASVTESGDVPAGSPKVIRTWALDTSRSLSWRGKYPLVLALPDRWVTWAISGITAGTINIWRNQYRALWTTFPIPTSVLIGFALKKITGIPWIVDIRDVMLDDEFPENPQERSVYGWLEQKVAKHADAVVVTTPGAMDIYQQRYPELAGRLHSIPNGFDESVFRKAESTLPRQDSASELKLTLLHSGLLSKVDRDPTTFFDAVAALKENGKICSLSLRIVFRACGNELAYQQEIETRNIADIVALEPPIPYDNAIQEMLQCDGLLLFQGSTCNHAIPAKLYEYLRCRKPLLAVTDPAGNVAQLLNDLKTGSVCNLGDSDEIAGKLLHMLRQIESKSFIPLRNETLTRFSRESQADDLSALLNCVGRSQTS